MSEFRVSRMWVDTQTLKTCFSIQMRVAPRKWLNCCEGSKPLFFRTKEAARAHIRKLQKEDS